jgi:hypothetical protein
LAAEIKSLRLAKDCRHRISNEDSGTVLEIFAVNQRIEGTGKKWKEHVKRMDGTRIAKQAVASQGVLLPILEKTGRDGESYKRSQNMLIPDP